MVDAVRLALPAEAGRIAAVQRRAWAAELPDPMAELMLSDVTVEQMTASWQAAITRPPLAQFRVLVAVATDGRVAGFAAVGPSDDADASPADDGLIAEFVIDPPARGRGHGSRLLNACVDTLKADGFTRATWWLRSTADGQRSFAASSGWGPDGAHAEIGAEGEGPRAKVIRLHTDISPA